ncbi:protein TonB [Chryseobacterium piscicola]|jgi:protein TonB|uniref:Energy transducer TonB n=1 Tax=Chryseobacterium piscicola TaxID=551459 RepID=A0A1N7NAW1_9FLAO|nr:energy transducer TonB [Chryseobacterium piscicola]PQA92228.1 energy transducer TonB [Chryseobacterium piscicola]SIS95442.1 protein TonB [Chryseobacterium piscicola]
MSTDNYTATTPTLDEVVFERRNKEYGAYDLRLAYRSLLTKAFLLGTLIFVLLVVGPFLYLKMTQEKAKEEKIVEVNLDDIKDLPPPPEEIKAPPPPPPPPVEPPKVEIVKDMIPEPKPNPKREEPPKKMEETKDTTIGTADQKGEKTTAFVQPPPPKDTGAGKAVEAPKADPNKIIEGGLEQQADFIGGIEKFRRLVGDNFDQSDFEGLGETISSSISFVVERDGTISDVRATGSNSAFNKEAEKTIRGIKGKWTPGKMQGDYVRSRFRLPLKMAFE